MNFVFKHLLIALGSTTLSIPMVAHALNNETQALLKREIVFVAQPDSEPFEFTRAGQLTGMNIELVQWMAVDMGFKIRIETAPLAEAMELVRTGQADVIIGLLQKDSLAEEFNTTDATKRLPVSIYARTDRTDIDSPHDLDGRKVGIVGAGRAMEVLQLRGIMSEIRFLSSVADGVEMLLAGQIDALIADEITTQYQLFTTGQKTLRIVGDPLYTSSMCMAVRKNNRDLLNLLNSGIAHARKTGTFNKIQTKWLGVEYTVKGMPAKTILLIVSIAAFVVAIGIALILLWNRRLQLKVAEQTRQYAESEERLRQLFENSPDAVYVLDREGLILSANERACKMVKMEKQKLLTKRIHDLTPIAFQEEVNENMRLWFSKGLKQCEGVSKAVDGSISPIEMTGTLQNLGGKTVLQLHVRDITLRKEAEEKLHAARQIAEDAKNMADRARKIAENASQAKSEFVANMSHEIRTPLNGIVGMAQLISDAPLTGEQNTCVETILQSTSGLINIINHVLDISKIEAGQMDVHESVIDLREMCRVLHQRFLPQAEQRGVILQCSCQDNVPLYVLGDEGLIEQILVNLLGNALKFTHEGSVILNIECPNKTNMGAALYFQIIDNGIGIEKETQATIFDKFTQADGSTKRLYGGTGLGLAICKQLVELMGGEIGLISSPGKGSTFFFNLTLRQASHPAEIKIAESQKQKTITRENVRVLLVEDNLVNQKVATAILSKAGCHVDTADNGQDAIQQIRRENYTLVLMDCQMPIMDGFEATAHIRSMKAPICDIPIIAITAHAMKEDKIKCLNAGMNDYISKPVNRQALIDLINKYAQAE